MLRSAIRLVSAGALLAVVVGASAWAQPADKRTYFTFSGPVAMPGVNLPAGKYLFRLGDPTSGRRIVQVMSEDGRKPIGLFFSIPSQRPEESDKPEVRFIETPRGTPAAIRTWWYPGERTGYEFIYPKEQARRLAQATRQPGTDHAGADDEVGGDQHGRPESRRLERRRNQRSPSTVLQRKPPERRRGASWHRRLNRRLARGAPLPIARSCQQPPRDFQRCFSPDRWR